MEAAQSSKMLVPNTIQHNKTQCHNPEDHDLNIEQPDEFTEHPNTVKKLPCDEPFLATASSVLSLRIHMVHM
jgi:hypothetical protein